MGMFDGLEIGNGVEEQKDIVGGFAKVDHTGLYDFEIVKAYADVAGSGAFSVTVHFKSDKGANFRVTEYISSGTKKGCKNYYIDKNGNKQFLPGYNKIKNLDSLLGFNRDYPSTTSGQVMLWDRDLSKEVPQPKEVITEWVGKKVSALVMKKYLDKQVMNEDTGKYEPTSESKVEYEVQHFLNHDTKQTRNEIVAGENGFKDKWLNKFDENFIMDKRDKSKGHNPEVTQKTTEENQNNSVNNEEDPF